MSLGLRYQPFQKMQTNASFNDTSVSREVGPMVSHSPPIHEVKDSTTESIWKQPLYIKIEERLRISPFLIGVPSLHPVFYSITRLCSFSFLNDTVALDHYYSVHKDVQRNWPVQTITILLSSIRWVTCFPIGAPSTNFSIGTTQLHNISRKHIENNCFAALQESFQSKKCSNHVPLKLSNRTYLHHHSCQLFLLTSSRAHISWLLTISKQVEHWPSLQRILIGKPSLFVEEVSNSKEKYTTRTGSLISDLLPTSPCLEGAFLVPSPNNSFLLYPFVL